MSNRVETFALTVVVVCGTVLFIGAVADDDPLRSVAWAVVVLACLATAVRGRHGRRHTT